MEKNRSTVIIRKMKRSDAEAITEMMGALASYHGDESRTGASDCWLIPWTNSSFESRLRRGWGAGHAGAAQRLGLGEDHPPPES